MDPLPEEELVTDAKVEFKGEAFDIVRDMFCQYCETLHSSMDSTDPIMIDLDVSLEAVKQFIEACQNREFFLSVDIVYDILDLAAYMEARQLEARIRGWIAERRIETYVAEFLFNLKRGNDLDDNIRAIHDNFEAVIDDNLLFSVPFDHLSKMINYDADPLKLFDFLMKSLDKFGPSASVLFAGVSLANLTLEQVHTLRYTPNFDWSYFGESKGRIHHEVVTRSLRQRRSMDDLAEDNRKLRQLHAELREDLARTRAQWAAKGASEAEGLRMSMADSMASFEAHLASEGRRIDAAVDTFKRDVSQEAVAAAQDYFFNSQAWKNFERWRKLHPESRYPARSRSSIPTCPPTRSSHKCRGSSESSPFGYSSSHSTYSTSHSSPCTTPRRQTSCGDAARESHAIRSPRPFGRHGTRPEAMRKPGILRTWFMRSKVGESESFAVDMSNWAVPLPQPEWPSDWRRDGSPIAKAVESNLKELVSAWPHARHCQNGSRKSASDVRSDKTRLSTRGFISIKKLVSLSEHIECFEPIRARAICRTAAAAGLLCGHWGG
jgi:hypothetical protein